MYIWMYVPSQKKKETPTQSPFFWLNIFLVFLLVIYLQNYILSKQNSTVYTVAFLYLNVVISLIELLRSWKELSLELCV